jgi:hypothetical protein
VWRSRLQKDDDDDDDVLDAVPTEGKVHTVSTVGKKLSL